MVEPLTAAEADDACFDIQFSRKFVEKYCDHCRRHLPPPAPRQRPGASRTAMSSRLIQAPRLRSSLALPNLPHRLRPAPR